MEEQRNQKRRKKSAPFLRAVLEVGFIVFLFYSNLLTGEFTHSGAGHSKGLLWAVKDIFTITNFMRSVLEVGFIVFLFYSNLLMGEFTHSGAGHSKGLLWAVKDIFTITNFM